MYTCILIKVFVHWENNHNSLSLNQIAKLTVCKTKPQSKMENTSNTEPNKNENTEPNKNENRIRYHEEVSIPVCPKLKSGTRDHPSSKPSRISCSIIYGITSLISRMISYAQSPIACGRRCLREFSWTNL
jgi:hypothetical protein